MRRGGGIWGGLGGVEVLKCRGIWKYIPQFIFGEQSRRGSENEKIVQDLGGVDGWMNDVEILNRREKHLSPYSESRGHRSLLASSNSANTPAVPDRLHLAGFQLMKSSFYQEQR